MRYLTGLVFLRTDLYGVLITATGCRNLWRVTSLLLRQAFGRLTADQQSELDRADRRDRRTGRWFRWIYLGGTLALAGYFALFVLPVLTEAASWTWTVLATGPRQPGSSAWW